MPDKPDYMDGVRHKERVFDANGVPAVFLYPRDLRGPKWPERVIETIEKSCCGQQSGSRSAYGQWPSMASGSRWMGYGP